MFLDVLGIAERACGGTQGKKWDARCVAISGLRLHRTRAEREYGGLCRSCLEDLRALANPYAQQFLTRTILSFKTTLDWMVNEPDLNACADRGAR